MHESKQEFNNVELNVLYSAVHEGWKTFFEITFLVIIPRLGDVIVVVELLSGTLDTQQFVDCSISESIKLIKCERFLEKLFTVQLLPIDKWIIIITIMFTLLNERRSWMSKLGKLTAMALELISAQMLFIPPFCLLLGKRIYCTLPPHPGSIHNKY